MNTGKKKVGPKGYGGKRQECPMCGLVDQMTRHHVRPRQVAGNATDAIGILRICYVCHNYLHNTFTNEFLGERLFDLDLILANENVKLFIAKRRKSQ